MTMNRSTVRICVLHPPLSHRQVRDVFRLAKENAPSIVFIDEVDSIATKRFDAQTGADREVQRYAPRVGKPYGCVWSAEGRAIL